MKFLTTFNENYIQEGMEDYFKDKIDWKFLNYILDKLTKYEDQGYFINILVCVFDEMYWSRNFIYQFYSTTKGYANEYSEFDLGKKVRQYNENYLIYSIAIMKTDTDECYHPAQNSFFQTIENRCQKIESTTNLILRPI